MNRKQLPRTLCATAIAAACACAWAQTGPSTQRIEVTGSLPDSDTSVASGALRSRVPVDKTPQSVVVLTRQLVDEQGLRTLTEALTNSASVRGTDTRDQFNAGLRIRGFEAGVLIDGVALPGTFSTPDLLAGVSRIEVVKGPAGTLYGGSQTAGNGGFVGGLVAVTTAAPQPVFSARAGVRVGTSSLAGVAADLNAPLGQGLAFRLQAEVDREDSETDRVRPQRLAVQPALAWRPNRDSELVLRWRHTQNKGLDYSGLPRKGTVESAAYSVPRSRILTAEGLPDTESNLDLVNLQWTQRLSDQWSWQITVADVRADVDQRGTFALDSTTFGWPATSAFDGPAYGLFGARLWNRMHSTVVSPSVTGRFDAFGARHTLTAGMDFDRTSDDAFLVFSPGGGFLGLIDITNPVFPAWAEPVEPGTPTQQNRYRSTGAYVQDHADFGSLQLLASLRHTSVKVTDVNPPFVDNRTDQSRTLGRLGAVYAFTPQVSAFAGWGEGMRVPTYAVFTEPPKPELSEQAELGLRLSNLAGLSATIAWFDLKLRIALAADPVNIGQTLQVAQEKSSGLDVDLQWQVTAATRVLASLSQISTKVVDTGKRFVDVPRTTARVALRHDFGAGSGVPGLGVGVGLTHHSALAGDAANTFETPAATVLDAQVSYRIGTVDLGLVARNLADKKYWVPSRYFGGGQVTPAPRRSLVAPAQMQF